jgi:hypothetical protein
MDVSIRLTWFHVKPTSQLMESELPLPLVAEYNLRLEAKSGGKRTKASVSPVGAFWVLAHFAPPSVLIKVRASAAPARILVLSFSL